MEGDVEYRIKSVMSNVFELPLKRITEKSSSENISSWDSLSQIQLTLALEEEFRFELSPDEMSQLLNFEQIKNIITKKLHPSNL